VEARLPLGGRGFKNDNLVSKGVGQAECIGELINGRSLLKGPSIHYVTKKFDFTTSIARSLTDSHQITPYDPPKQKLPHKIKWIRR